MLGRRRAGLPGPRRVGNRGRVAERPDRVAPTDAEVIVHNDPAPLVERQAEVLAARVWHDSRRPDHGASGQRLARRDPCPVGRDLLERGSQPDVDPPAAQLEGRVLGEAGVDLGQHPVHRLCEHPAHAVEAGPRVELHRLGCEVLQLGERLETGVAASDEEESEQLLAQAGVVGRIGELEALDHVVPQPDRIGKALEADRMLVEAGDREHPGDRAERQDQPVIGKLVLGSLLVAHPHRAGGGVVPDRNAQPELGPPEHVTKRGDDVAGFERARGRLRQEGRVEEEVDVVDERDASALGRHRALELAGGVVAAEATADDHDVPGHEAIVAPACNNLLQDD